MTTVLGTAAGLSALLLVAFSWWFQTGWPGTVAYAAFGVVAIITVPLAYRWFGFHDSDAIGALLAQENREYREMLARLNRLEHELSEQDNSEGTRQANTLMKLLNDFHEVIANRFPGKQLTASNYLNAARRVQNQAIQNLSDMVGIGHTISSLRLQSGDASAQLAEQVSRVDNLLADNEKLFTGLTETSVEVANIQEIGDFERTETLARLNDLARIAKQQGT